MPDDLWEELSQDLPSKSDPFLQQYLAGRESLIGKEKETRSDASFRKALTPIARRACAIVDRIRAQEQAAVWTPNVEEQLARETKQSIFPGMMFMLAKDRMEQTKLWKIVRRMPKGCLLHAHMDAMVDFDFILDQLLKTPGMHMSSDVSLKTHQARENAIFRFRFRAKELVSGSIWDENYEPGSFILLTKVADEFPEGGRSGFLKWLKSRCTLSLIDSHEQHHGIDAIWEKFAKCFVVVATMIHYEPMFRAFLRHLMSLLKADGVNWAELRYEYPLRSPLSSQTYMSFILFYIYDKGLIKVVSHGRWIIAVTAVKSRKRTTATCARSSRRKSPSSRPQRRAKASGGSP